MSFALCWKKYLMMNKHSLNTLQTEIFRAVADPRSGWPEDLKRLVEDPRSGWIKRLRKYWLD